MRHRAQTRYFTTSKGKNPRTALKAVRDAGPDVPRRWLAVKLRPTEFAARRNQAPRLTGRTSAMYQSDITQFINQLKDQKPQLEEQQRKGRALLWDKQPIDLEERERQQASRVRQTSYVYYQNF
jgi:hypothetical protein